MAPEDAVKSTQASKEELDVISNRIALALAKRDSLVKSWTALSARLKEPEKTQEELDAEDAALFRKEPPYLGVGAPIPSHFLISDAERNNKSLRAKFFPTKGLHGSKARDEEEKAASAKRALMEESSDEEGGRSSLGKAKKRKTTTPVSSKEAEIEEEPNVKGTITKEKQVNSITPPATPSKKKANTPAENPILQKLEDSKVTDSQDEVTDNQDEAPLTLDHETTVSKTIEEARREKMRQRKISKRKQKKNKNKARGEASLATNGTGDTLALSD